jgi:Uma2 family endonuclease
MWLTAGTPMVVVVDPRKRAVVVHRPDADTLILNDGETLDGGDVVPGWRLPVADLFA